MPRANSYQVFKNGALVSTAPLPDVSDAQIEREQAPAQLAAALARLTQIANQAQAASDATGALTLAQLTAQHRTLAGMVADEARVLRALVVREYGE